MSFDFLGIKNDIYNSDVHPQRNTVTVKPNISEASVFIDGDSYSNISGDPEYEAPDNRTFDSAFNMVFDAYIGDSSEHDINLTESDFLDILYATMKDPENVKVTGMSDDYLEKMDAVYKTGNLHSFLHFLYEASDSLENLQLYDLEFEVE